MTDMQIRRMNLDVLYVKSKVAAQSVSYRGLWNELLRSNLQTKPVEEVSNDKLDPKRR